MRRATITQRRVLSKFSSPENKMIPAAPENVVHDISPEIKAPAKRKKVLQRKTAKSK